MIDTIPNIICTFAALAALASAIAALVGNLIIAKMSFTSYSDDDKERAQGLIDGSGSMRNALIILLIILFVMASDSVYIAGYPRLSACSVLCRSYAGALIPSLLITLISDVVCIIRRSGSTSLRVLRSTARSFSFWSIVVSLVFSFLLFG